MSNVQCQTNFISVPDPRVVGEPGVTSVTTSDRHIENVMNKDTTVGLSEQQEYSVCNSGAKMFGTESCIRESPALKVERICDTTKRQDPTLTSSASSNRGSLPNMETRNLIDDMNKPAVTAESDLQCGNVKSSTGLSEEVEAMDVNVYVANSSVVVIWLPPFSCFPELSLLLGYLATGYCVQVLEFI
ncbi:hypothetical protein DPX16_14615 [Anabarilius grahami]|uniref:Uncharacterized protein n=1 Tax=Anabarilius grahami TaxID=495550 RepID=A0A3N0YYX9_ANAGA|nr:hypothetical protein DPX16_14615 [Anabarilius grahami]